MPVRGQPKGGHSWYYSKSILIISDLKRKDF
jgi:hypothetical protein